MQVVDVGATATTGHGVDASAIRGQETERRGTEAKVIVIGRRAIGASVNAEKVTVREAAKIGANEIRPIAGKGTEEKVIATRVIEIVTDGKGTLTPILNRVSFNLPWSAMHPRVK
jgi:hypothetical protein